MNTVEIYNVAGNAASLRLEMLRGTDVHRDLVTDEIHAVATMITRVLDIHEADQVIAKLENVMTEHTAWTASWDALADSVGDMVAAMYAGGDIVVGAAR